MKACVNCEGPGTDCFEIEKNPALKRAVKDARRNMVPDNYIKRVIQFAKQGYKDIAFDTYDTDWDGEAYRTVSGQNSNNSVRVTDDFLKAVETDGDWNLTARKNGKVMKTMKARTLWDKIGYAAWASADPGIQFHSTINDWHTCKASGDIRASNPCSEYMFLDDTACNLASLNLIQFKKADGSFDIASYEHATRLWTIVLEISVLMAQFPSKEIAKLSYEYRTLGLGFANIGGLLMTSGIPYDSHEGRAICAAISAIMTGISYATSAEMAKERGPFPGFAKNREHMLRVMRNHRRAAYGAAVGYEGVATAPVPLDENDLKDKSLANAARRAWDLAVELGEQHGYRNAQSTVVAPTGTIGLVMDCDTTGIEPDFALVKFKKLAGGGYFKIINQAVPEALALPRLSARADRTDHQLRRGPWLAGGCPCPQPCALKPRVLAMNRLPRSKRVSLRPSTSSSSSTSGRWAKTSAVGTLKITDAQLNDFSLRPPRPCRLLQGRHRQGQHPCLRCHDAGRRSGPQGRAPAGLRLRQPLRPHRQALPLGRKPHPHDGGLAALHLGCHFQDHQHAE